MGTMKTEKWSQGQPPLHNDIWKRCPARLVLELVGEGGGRGQEGRHSRSLKLLEMSCRFLKHQSNIGRYCSGDWGWGWENGQPPVSRARVTSFLPSFTCRLLCDVLIYIYIVVLNPITSNTFHIDSTGIAVVRPRAVFVFRRLLLTSIIWWNDMEEVARHPLCRKRLHRILLCCVRTQGTPSIHIFPWVSVDEDRGAAMCNLTLRLFTLLVQLTTVVRSLCRGSVQCNAGNICIWRSELRTCGRRKNDHTPGGLLQRQSWIIISCDHDGMITPCILTLCISYTSIFILCISCLFPTFPSHGVMSPRRRGCSLSLAYFSGRCQRWNE